MPKLYIETFLWFSAPFFSNHAHLTYIVDPVKYYNVKWIRIMVMPFRNVSRTKLIENSRSPRYFLIEMFFGNAVMDIIKWELKLHKCFEDHIWENFSFSGISITHAPISAFHWYSDALVHFCTPHHWREHEIHPSCFKPSVSTNRLCSGVDFF